MELQKLIKTDLYRYFGTQHPSRRCRVGGERLQLRYLKTLRKAEASAGKPLNLWWRFRLLRLSERTHIQIPWNCEIGPGFYIGHRGRIIVNPQVRIGASCNIATGVTIGAIYSGKRQGAPVIGNRVWIGANAVIVGGIVIGDDVAIAPGAYVNFDVPSHSVVIGNPGAVHHKEQATEGMIQNPVEC